MQGGDLFIVSAPSGTGKTTLRRKVLSDLEGFGGVDFSVSYTTREPRAGEAEGGDYHFVSEQRFEAMIAAGAFLEWARYNGNLYGTARDEVLPRLAAGRDVLLEIEVQGAEQVMESYPAVHSIFVLPPSAAALESRLVSRGSDAAGDISRRLAVSLSEIKRYARYEYVIINDDLDRASRALAAIILEKRHRLERVDARVQTILEEFKRASTPR